ncbi:MAG: hypothetical protein K2J15_02590 [Muribaculaceae bacterium]|nr:hypothetical protein [Muribaculaceae bacterium]
MKQRVFNLIILDESGSMSSIEKQAIDGVNETVQTIRAAQKKHEEQKARRRWIGRLANGVSQRLMTDGYFDESDDK